MRGYILHNTGEEVQEAIDDVREKTVYANATHHTDGLMSSQDKIKLDNFIDSSEEMTIEEINELLDF